MNAKNFRSHSQDLLYSCPQQCLIYQQALVVRFALQYVIKNATLLKITGHREPFRETSCREGAAEDDREELETKHSFIN